MKLGISATPEKRRANLQTGHPQYLHLFHREPVEDETLEKLLHDVLDDRRVRGEWFRVNLKEAKQWLSMIACNGRTLVSKGRAREKRKPGRPRKPDAMSGAERQRRAREKKKTASLNTAGPHMRKVPGSEFNTDSRQ